MDNNLIKQLQTMHLYSIDNSIFSIENLTPQKLVVELSNFASKYAISGDILKGYICYFLINNQNAFSLSCEYRPLNKQNSLATLADSDIQKLMQLYFCDLSQELDSDSYNIITKFNCVECVSYNKIITQAIVQLRAVLDKIKNTSQAIDVVAKMYEGLGVGDLGLHKAFKIIKTEELQKKTNCNIATLLPISATAENTLNDIIGYDLQKNQIIDNTKAFLQGKKANNVLLYGDGGTGKSSSIKAILNEFYPQGLRIIEVYKHQFSYISDIINQIKNRNYKFIIYLDDLSFEDFEIEYKYFKAIIDGGMEVKPNNVLIYATSNRRHLIKESYNDKNDIQFDGELHKSDTVQEKLSLVARFGLSIYFGAPNQLQYLEIVKKLAKQYNIDIEQSELERKALTWSIRNNGKSGRTAEQFINSLL